MSVREVIRSCNPKGKGEVAKNAYLARALNNAGHKCKMSRSGFDIVGDDWVIEGKDGFESSAELDRCVGQLRKYSEVIKGRAVLYVIYERISRASLLRLEKELDGVCGFQVHEVILKKGTIEQLYKPDFVYGLVRV